MFTFASWVPDFIDKSVLQFLFLQQKIYMENIMLYACSPLN